MKTKPIKISSVPVFPRLFQKKIDKTTEGRSGKGIYKRRNSRNYRVIMHYSTYKKIMSENPDFLYEYENGYAIRMTPEQYFEEAKYDPSVKLGENAFVYYKTIDSLRNEHYKPLPEWREVAELYTSNSKDKGSNREWIGEYALFIQNTVPQQTSSICGKGGSLSASERKAIMEEFELLKLPQQAGLGNFDYDYATKEEMDNIRYQLSYLILSINGMEDYLYRICKEDREEQVHEFPMIAYEAAGRSQEDFRKLYQRTLRDIEDYCDDNGLLDFDKLSSIRAWDAKQQEPICPLCLETLNAGEFIDVEDQAEGREEEDNTRSKIALMHIHALRSGELNHRTYNLGWGHRHCNQIQEDLDIETTLKMLRRIVDNNKGLAMEEDSIPVEESTPEAPSENK